MIRVTIAEAEVPVYSRPDKESPLLIKLPAGEEIGLGRAVKTAGGDWVEAVLSERRQGYIPGSSRILEIRPVTLDEKTVDLFKRASSRSGRKARLDRGQVVTLIAQLPGEKGEWLKIRMNGGVEGYVRGGIRFKEMQKTQAAPVPPETEQEPAGAPDKPSKPSKTWSYYVRQGLLEVVLGLVASLILYLIPKKFPGKGYMMWGTILPGAWTIARGGWLRLRRGGKENQ